MANKAQEVMFAFKNITRWEESDIRQLEYLAKRAIDADIYGGGILTAIAGAIRESKPLANLPLRNCDIGTPDEQLYRFDDFCERHKNKNGICVCPFMYATHYDKECFAHWAQMPYEKGGEE